MNELGRRNGEGVAGDPRARCAVVEARAERQQHVGLTRGVVGLIVAAARDHAERQRMMGVDGAKPAHRRRHRNLQTLGQLEQFLGRATVAHGLPDENDGAFGGQQHVDRLHDAFRIGAAAARNIGAPFLRLRRFLRRRLQEHVERHIQHHRPRTAGHHGLPRLPHGERHHLAARRLKNLLAAGPHHGGKIRLVLAIHFLERAAIELARRHIAGDGEKRHRVRDRRWRARSADWPSPARRT